MTDNPPSSHADALAAHPPAEQGSEKGKPRGLLPDTFDELYTTIEELRVAEEEMRAQNEELIATRLRVEAERQRYLNLFEFAPDGYLLTTAEGKILEVNQVASALLGIKARFLKGRLLAISVAPDDLPAFDARLRDAGERLLSPDVPAAEWPVRLRRRHVGLFPAALSVTPVPSPPEEAPTLRWLVRDLSRSAPRERSAAAALDAFPDAVFLCDSEGRVSFFNAAAARLTQAAGQTVQEFADHLQNSAGDIRHVRTFPAEEGGLVLYVPGSPED